MFVVFRDGRLRCGTCVAGLAETAYTDLYRVTLRPPVFCYLSVRCPGKQRTPPCYQDSQPWGRFFMSEVTLNDDDLRCVVYTKKGLRCKNKTEVGNRCNSHKDYSDQSVARRRRRAKRNREVREQSREAAGKRTVSKAGYSDYITNSPVWKSTRRRYLEAPHPVLCRGCGKRWGKGDHLHHRTYKNLGNEDPKDLVPLCPPCHSEVHDLERDLMATGLKRPEALTRATNKVLKARGKQLRKGGWTWL